VLYSVCFLVQMQMFMILSYIRDHQWMPAALPSLPKLQTTYPQYHVQKMFRFSSCRSSRHVHHPITAITTSTASIPTHHRPTQTHPQTTSHGCMSASCCTAPPSTQGAHVIVREVVTNRFLIGH